MRRRFRRKVVVLLLLGTGFIARPGIGLTPPWEESELTARSDLVVVGEIGAPVECVGRPERLEVGRKVSYAVPLKIREVLKGTAKLGEVVSLRFTHLFYKPGYTGDQDADHAPGEVGRYYLQRLKEEGHARVVHWSGAIVLRAGKGSLPTCAAASGRRS
ncbi:MAG: hypothetical protein HY543_08185 [Deltaproteobacteria bacterium]|nr:hypothetical protein [Deltaproteobacteria bacterium]